MASEAGNHQVTVLRVGLTKPLAEEVTKLLPKANHLELQGSLEKLVDAVEPFPAIIVCGVPEAPATSAELAQILRGVYIHSAIYLVQELKQGTDRKTVMKNGFTDVFFLPIDKPLMERVLNEAFVLASSQGRAFRAVRLIDVVPNTVLDFSTYLYLSANQKYVKFSSAGDPIDKERSDRLKSHSVTSLSVPIEEIKKFYAYTAAMLKSTKTNPALSATERAEHMAHSVRNILTGLFSDHNTSAEVGKQTVTDLQGIVSSYIKAGAPEGADLYNKVLALPMQNNDAYSHAVATSTLGSLFALGLNTDLAEDVAVAGMLHDLGLAEIPPEVLMTPQSQWLPVDQEIFQAHPERAIELIRTRKLVASEGVHKIILQHHEKFGGGGFPKGLKGDRICMGAQILAIADAMHELMVEIPGRKQLGPREAVEELLKNALGNPQAAAHDPEILKKVATLLGSGGAASKEKAA